MSVIVHYDAKDEKGEIECDFVKEGESGLFLKENDDEATGKSQVGYVPFEAVSLVEPAD